MVSAFLADAESKPSSSTAVQFWLKKLQGVVTDANAVVDQFQYELLRRKIEVRGRLTKKVSNFFSPSKNQLSFRLKLGHKIKSINEKLDAIYKEATDLKLDSQINDDLSQQIVSGLIQSTHPGVDVKSVIGRDGDVSEIVKELVSLENEEDLPVISIIGMGGLGKTTLAQLVYRDASVDDYFDTKVWVCVSDDFNVNRVLNEMAQSLTLTNPQLPSNDAVIKLLGQHLDMKRYLLVLDDVWNEHQDVWNSMRNALLQVGGSKGSKIIVTSRSQKVAQVMGSYSTHVLSGLSHAESMKLFKRKAFGAGGAPETRELLEIGEEVVERCGGVPLVIGVLGGLLHSKKTKDEWLAIRNSSRWGEIEDISSQVDKVLQISYDHLSPLSLKHCFAYSSILPKDSAIYRGKLVEIWMALGLLPSRDDGLDLEDMGDNYFLHLLGRSLLQGAEGMGDYYGDDYVKWSILQDLQEIIADEFEAYINGERYNMHDLVHDLALKASKGNCLTLSGYINVDNISNTVIHLTLLHPKKHTLELARGCFKRLHSLFLEGKGSLHGIFFEDLKLLRVLTVIDNEAEELPPSIGKLKHLRFLDISSTSISKLPSSFTKLYNLQTLRVRNVIGIPPKFGNLVNLRHICGGGFVIGVGKLTSLRTLSVFAVSRERGCLVGELGGLTKLKGTLCILCVGEIEDAEEAKRAKLVDKSGIEALRFVWEDEELERENGEWNNTHDGVLEGLRPHSNLKSLKIENFKGIQFSSWMRSESLVVLNNLVEIKLLGCDQCEQVPTLGHLPNLKKVLILGLKKVKKIGEEFYRQHDEGDELYFPSLIKLVLDSMDTLEEWVDVKQVNQSSSSSSLAASKVKAFQFPMLEELEISDCVNLMVVPSQFPSLKKLSLSDNTNSGLELQKMSKGLTCLTRLHLLDVSCEVESVLEELFHNNSRSLIDVVIYGCSQLKELPKDVFKDCVALKNLVFNECSNIKAVPDVGGLTSLQRLVISGCGALMDLPSGIETLTSLRHLTIQGCLATSGSLLDLGNLTRLEDLSIRRILSVNQFPRLPTSLRSLSLTQCPDIQEMPQQHLARLSGLETFGLENIEGLEALPDWLPNLSSLKRLNLSACNDLKSMPTADSTRRLKDLRIDECPLLKERCIKGCGADWHNIQHIPYIKIDGETIQDTR